jgi:glutaminase
VAQRTSSNRATFVPAQSICRNPFVNFGAIIVTDRLPSLTGDAVTATIGLMRTANPAAPIASDDEVARSETMTGHRNSAIAHVLAEHHRLINEIDHGLAQYFAQCLGLCTKRFSRRIFPGTYVVVPADSQSFAVNKR